MRKGNTVPNVRKFDRHIEQPYFQFVKILLYTVCIPFPSVVWKTVLPVVGIIAGFKSTVM